MTPLTSRHVTPSHCLRLRHKGMYVTSQDDDSELAAYRDGIEATAYWCSRTQKSFGPDGHPVTAELCCHGRACCE